MSDGGGEARRMRLRGLHHVTAVVADADRTLGFYRDLLGLAVVRDGPSDDDPSHRHVWLADPSGTPGRIVSFMEYPELPAAQPGRGGVHHWAFLVSGADELGAWRDYLRSRDVEVTEVYERGPFKSIYLRDPDGHVVEIATPPSGSPPLPD